MAITIHRATVADIEAAPNFLALLQEYGAESANQALGPVNPQMATYKGMEAAGMLHALSAHKDGQLIGFMLLLTPILPHFGRRAAVIESWFVAGAHRRGGAGLGLLGLAEQIAKEAGAAGIMASAPTGGRLEQVMPRIGYREASKVFFKDLR